MSEIDDGGKVYPEIYYNEMEKIIIRNNGISRRDWLAGLAMQALITKYGFNSIIGKESYRYADNMIAWSKAKSENISNETRY